MKVKEYTLELMIQNPPMVKISDLMSCMDLGVDGIWESLKMTFETTSKWDKKKVQEFIKILEKEGWKVHKTFKLAETLKS